MFLRLVLFEKIKRTNFEIKHQLYSHLTPQKGEILHVDQLVFGFFFEQKIVFLCQEMQIKKVILEYDVITMLQIAL